MILNGLRLNNFFLRNMNWIVEYQAKSWKKSWKNPIIALKLPKSPYFFPLFVKESFLNRTLGPKKSLLNQTTYLLKNRLHQQSFLNRDSFLNQAFLNRDSTVFGFKGRDVFILPCHGL